jgi:hypothetical protein
MAARLGLPDGPSHHAHPPRESVNRCRSRSPRSRRHRHCPRNFNPQHVASPVVVFAVSPFAAYAGICFGLYPCCLPYRRPARRLGATSPFSNFTFGTFIKGRRRTALLSDFTFGPAIRGPQPPVRRSPSHPGLTAFLVFISFHLHILCDIIGARGPDGDQWPIPYLKPFSNAQQLTWHGQWALNAWQNFVITGLFLVATFWIAWRYGNSPLELISEPANQALTRTLRKRFQPTSAQP